MKESKQRKYDIAYLKMAQEWAKLSYCKRKQVGALIVKDKITDTLCGTKSFYRKDWDKFEKFSNFTNNTDHWGDFNIIFGSYYFFLNIQEFPIRYYARLSGESKMTNRFLRFIKMLRNCFLSFKVFYK